MITIIYKKKTQTTNFLLKMIRAARGTMETIVVVGAHIAGFRTTTNPTGFFFGLSTTTTINKKNDKRQIIINTHETRASR